MGTYTLRLATQKDAAPIHAMVLMAGINPTGLDWPRFWVAGSEFGEVVGCVQLKPHQDGSLELASLVVQEDWRGRGVAHALIEKCLAGQTGPLYLMCRSGLGEFYTRFGFFPLAINDMPPYFRRVSRLANVLQGLRPGGEHLLVMKRDPK